MSSLLRDTQVGHLLRFISSNKLLRYPDEIDPSLRKKSLQKDTNPSIPRENSRLEKMETKNSATVTTTASNTATPASDHDLQNLKANHIAEDGEDGFLVD